MGPSSISPLTQSVVIVVNNGSPQVFNTTPTSPGCATVQGGVTCYFTVTVYIGTDKITVSTMSGTNGSGQILDSATAFVTINPSGNSPIAITLGPVVRNTADSGPGSLREAIADANPGDTVVALIGDEATVKKYYPEHDGRVRLQPANPSMDPIFVSEEELRIRGVVVGLMRHYR